MQQQCTHAASIEEWRPVIGFETWYEVSNLGRVRRIASGAGTHPGRILKPLTLTHGRPGVCLSVNGRVSTHRIHRLVAMAFLGHPKTGGTDINHIDGVKANNRVENLEWTTKAGNNEHALAHGLVLRGSVLPGAKLTEIEVAEIRRAYSEGGTTMAQIGARYGVSDWSISAIIRRETWRHI